jgi:hypothetical protein
VVQFDHATVPLPPLGADIPNMITAALALTVVIAVGDTDVDVAVRLGTVIVPGATSKTDEATPEKARMPPAPLTVPVPRANVKLAPSVPSTTLYKTVPRRALVEPPISRLSIRVHPVKDALIVLCPSTAKFAIITSPTTTPAGLVIVTFVLPVTPVALDLSAMFASENVVCAIEPILPVAVTVKITPKSDC